LTYCKDFLAVNMNDVYGKTKFFPQDML